MSQLPAKRIMGNETPLRITAEEKQLDIWCGVQITKMSCACKVVVVMYDPVQSMSM